MTCWYPIIFYNFTQTVCSCICSPVTAFYIAQDITFGGWLWLGSTFISAFSHSSWLIYALNFTICIAAFLKEAAVGLFSKECKPSTLFGLQWHWCPLLPPYALKYCQRPHFPPSCLFIRTITASVVAAGPWQTYHIVVLHFLANHLMIVSCWVASCWG